MIRMLFFVCGVVVSLKLRYPFFFIFYFFWLYEYSMAQHFLVPFSLNFILLGFSLSPFPLSWSLTCIGKTWSLLCATWLAPLPRIYLQWVFNPSAGEGPGYISLLPLSLTGLATGQYLHRCLSSHWWQLSYSSLLVMLSMPDDYLCYRGQDESIWWRSPSLHCSIV